MCSELMCICTPSGDPDQILGTELTHFSEFKEGKRGARVHSLEKFTLVPVLLPVSVLP